MHPIERLRYVARSSGADQRTMVRETAMALRGLRGDHAGLVTSCLRIVERHPASGSLWWLAARVLTATDPNAELTQLAHQTDADPTGDHLYDSLGEDVTVCVIGWPDVVADALVRRGDIAVLAVDVHGEGSGLVNRLHRSDVEAECIPLSGLGAAAGACDVVLLEASVAGMDGALAVTGSRAAAAVAYCAEIPVWMVAGLGRRLPGPMWSAVLGRLESAGNPWDLDDEFVPAGMISHVVGPSGLTLGAGDLGRAECPVAPELLRT